MVSEVKHYMVYKSETLHGVRSETLHGVRSETLHGVRSETLHGVRSETLHGVGTGEVIMIRSETLHGVGTGEVIMIMNAVGNQASSMHYDHSQQPRTMSRKLFKPSTTITRMTPETGGVHSVRRC